MDKLEILRLLLKFLTKIKLFITTLTNTTKKYILQKKWFSISSKIL